LVQDDDGCNPCSKGGHQGPADQVNGKGWFGCYHNEQLVDIGGKQFAAHVVRAKQHVLSGQDAFDDAFVVAGKGNIDEIADGGEGTLAPGKAVVMAAVGQFNHIVATVRGHDLASDVGFSC